jgi:hypothetical protein
MTLQLGVCLASDISDIDYAVLAEELGYQCYLATPDSPGRVEPDDG